VLGIVRRQGRTGIPGMSKNPVIKLHIKWKLGLRKTETWFSSSECKITTKGTATVL
jgi:hypothetical protein